MTTTTTSTARAPHEPDWHVLVLHDGQEKDILGIWGPYQSDTTARTAMEELQTWPIDGQWTIFACKQFGVPQLIKLRPTQLQPPYTVTWTNGDPIRQP